MDLSVLRWFRQVAGGATVTETAARARLTQPALSRALRRVEREVGTELFQKAGRTLRLTPAGHAFAERVGGVLDSYDQGVREVRELVDPDAGTVPLAFLHTLGTWLVPQVIRDFRDVHPRARFALRQHGEEGLVTELTAGTADLVLTSGDPRVPTIDWRRLLVEPLHLAVPPDHRLADRQEIRLAEAAEETFILLRPGYGLRATTEELCGQAGFAPRVGFEGEEVDTLRGLVTAGLGVALLPPPRSPSTAPHLLVTDVPAQRDIGLAWATGRDLPPLSTRFRDHILDR
ncbi:LysR family transcriptional regulator [Actinophytocola oryzae]|uniref:DNA-binding transcriptional LysR family regulator n=1 Tax=Actinophytocola oryzae TaxID=502181 RepID=A0A4R7W0X7_9PSEU|nr:LysR family transcriptional regulator [Actinophytocola oryzae]TDV55177.1 DNA-binding transcriptional LysR family regulator [Actinophytocola oryzae]